MNKLALFKFAFGCLPDVIPERVVLTPVIPPKRFAAGCEARTSFKGKLYSGYILDKNGIKFAVITSGIGDRLLADAVLLLGITCVQEILFAGVCGGFGDCTVGDMIVGESALNGEGFTRYYGEDFLLSDMLEENKDILPDNIYTRKLLDFVSGEDVKSGRIFTIGSLLAETDENLEKIQTAGFLGIDMELSAVYQAAKVIEKKITSILVVSDLPKDKPFWEYLPEEDRGVYRKSIDKAVKLAVGFVGSDW